MYIRYRQVQLAIDSDEIVLKQSWNTWAKWCGLIACLGMSFVANFQETTVGAMHFFGAIGAFGIGSVYFIVSVREHSSYPRRTFGANSDNRRCIGNQARTADQSRSE